nr:MAG TPA: hypothetical protein [Crassvirales sp.]
MLVLMLIAFLLMYILQLSLAYYAVEGMEMPNLVKGVLVVPMIGLVIMVSLIVVFLISQIFKE